MESVKISIGVDTSNPSIGLGLEIWVDQQQIKNIDHVDSQQLISFEVSLNKGQHELIFVMKNKTVDHTVIDSNNNIVKDAVIYLTNPIVDDIEIEKIMWAHAQYHHDHNGTTEPGTHSFYGIMGCNGRVVIPFETPTYLWLLENL